MAAELERDVDILIVGAGLSGIDAAYRFQTGCPDRRYVILEARDAIGGTWDLFRYPGIRSDSDMYTLGFPFRPWTGDKAIADGESIRDYVRDTAAAFGINRHIRFGTRVVAADWSSDTARWTVELVGPGGVARTMTCHFLYMGSGYYDYERGFTPEWPGTDRFQGRIVHPQHWPDDLDHDGRRVVVIGSGATAVTLVPAMAERAAHVTMVQRSPTYIVSRPSRDGFAQRARRLLPLGAAAEATRWKSILLGIATFTYARRQPDRVKAMILRNVRAQLPENYEIERDFEPRYAPWDQRICLVPDADLFQAIGSGRASIVTDTIARFTPTGLQLSSGQEIPADIVVTATGLNLRLFGGVTLSVDGAVVDPADRLVYKGMMLSGVPNLALAFGYTNASWTLKCDLTARHACRLLRHMERHGYASCYPADDDPSVTREPMLGFTSGYVRRAERMLPHQGSKAPWRVHQNYVMDLAALRYGKLEDGVMTFVQPPVVDPAAAPAAASAARPLRAPLVAAGIGAAAIGGLALFAGLTARRVQRQVPADGAFLDINGTRVHYLDRGSGPAIVMIHGLGGQIRNFSHSLLDRLADDHRVILIDRPGSGYSAALASADIAGQAALVARVLAALKVDRPLVVGHSLGGAVALALALDHPEAVGGLALIAPLTQPETVVPRAFRALAVESPVLRAVLGWTIAPPATLLGKKITTRMVFAPEAMPDDFAIRGGGALTARPSGYRSASADLVAARDGMAALAARYPTLTIPVGVLFGRDDAILSPTLHGEGLVAQVPGATLTLIDGGHMIPVTQPDATASWLRAQRRTSSPPAR